MKKSLGISGIAATVFIRKPSAFEPEPGSSTRGKSFGAKRRKKKTSIFRPAPPPPMES